MPEVYPPAHHVLRDLRLAFAAGADGRSRRVWLPVTPEVRTDDGHGPVRMGAIAVLVDVLGGGLAATAAAPDWIATADLTVHLGDLRAPGAHVEARGRVRRKGRTTVVMEVDLLAADETPLGLATMTFAVLPRRDANPVMPPAAAADTVTTMALPESGLAESLTAAAGIRVVDAASGRSELAVTDWVRNSMGALQGGIVATLAECATEAAARHRTGAPLVVTDLHVTYLGFGRVGPVRTEVTTAGDEDRVVAEVSVRDHGADERLMARVSAVATRVGAS